MHSGRAKNGARTKRTRERSGGGEGRERLPADPSILKNAHPLSRLISLIDSLSMGKTNDKVPDVKFYFLQNKLLHVREFSIVKFVMSKAIETPSDRCRICWCSFKVKFETASQPGKPGYISSENLFKPSKRKDARGEILADTCKDKQSFLGPVAGF